MRQRRKDSWQWYDRVLEADQVLEELGERAAPYFREEWKQLTPEEQLVLVQLAEEGLVNAKNRREVRRLLGRGLIRQRPEPALWNETFRRFVIENRKDAIDLETKDESTWDRLRWPLTGMLVGAIVFLALTQQDFFDTTIALVSGVAAAIPAAFRMLGFRGGQRRA